MHHVVNLFVNNIDGPGEIEKHPSAMNEAFRLGSELANRHCRKAEKTVDVELF